MQYMQLLSTHYRNNSLPQDFCFKIYNFFEDFPGKNCFLSQTLTRFSFQDFLSQWNSFQDSTRIIFFLGWITAWAAFSE